MGFRNNKNNWGWAPPCGYRHRLMPWPKHGGDLWGMDIYSILEIIKLRI